jgi:hypothetical protein
MTDVAPSSSETLAAALIVAFPGYVEGRLAPLGVLDDPAVIAAAETGCVGLGMALNELVAVPLHQQTHSPLELVRNAMSPIIEALQAAGVAPPQRDAHAAAIHPEDVYDLYPASSRDLGDEAWQLHVQWGLDKARVVAGMVPAPVEAGPTEEPGEERVVPALPSVALFGVDGEHRDEIAAAVAGLGYQTLVWRNPAALEAGLKTRPSLVLVDLGHPTAHDAIRSIATALVRVIAVGGMVDDFATAGVMALGAETAVQLDRVVERLPGLLPRIV